MSSYSLYGKLICRLRGHEWRVGMVEGKPLSYHAECERCGKTADYADYLAGRGPDVEDFERTRIKAKR